MPTSTTVLETLADSKQFEDLLDAAGNFKCDKDTPVILEHQNCFSDQNGNPWTPNCHRAILSLVILCISKKPDLLNDEVKKKLSDLLKRNNIKVEGLVKPDILSLLSSGTASQLMTWLKYELLISHLIKELLYEPKTMANELLALSKLDLDPKIATKLSPILGPCAKVCREINNKYSEDEEFEEKWCEIIDWMGWFISGDENM